MLNTHVDQIGSVISVGNVFLSLVLEPGKLTSTLTVPKAPALVYKTPLVFYHCYVSKTSYQAAFPVKIIKGKSGLYMLQVKFLGQVKISNLGQNL